jgi:UDP-N-acetylglucosamine acyltransferase
VHEKEHLKLIDKHALINPQAKLDSDVSIGPYSVIGPDVQIAGGTWIGSHVIIKGPTRIGRDNKIYQFASIGEIPQDKKFDAAMDKESALEIGDRNEIREYCTLNRGTQQGGGVTRIGNDNWIMAYCHIAHDCFVGNDTIFGNGTTLAGHIEIGDYVIFGGFTLIHQFCRIGKHSFSGGGTVINKDVPPFVMVVGNRAKAFSINKEGLRRRGFNPETIRALYKAYKIIYRQGLTINQAIETLQALSKEYIDVRDMLSFLQKSERGIVRPE